MNESYLIINGKRIDLTPEQLATLGIETKKSPFERLKESGSYYYIDIDGSVQWTTDGFTVEDVDTFAAANYCTDENLMEHRALHEILNRRLWRYSMEHDGDKIYWIDGSVKYEICYKVKTNVFETSGLIGHRYLGNIYFYTEEIAKAAIEEIVKPFLEEHPEFKW